MAKKQFKAESRRLLDLMINSIYTLSLIHILCSSFSASSIPAPPVTCTCRSL